MNDCPIVPRKLMNQAIEVKVVASGVTAYILYSFDYPAAMIVEDSRGGSIEKKAAKIKSPRRSTTMHLAQFFAEHAMNAKDVKEYEADGIIANVGKLVSRADGADETEPA